LRSRKNAGLRCIAHARRGIFWASLASGERQSLQEHACRVIVVGADGAERVVGISVRLLAFANYRPAAQEYPAHRVVLTRDDQVADSGDRP
jgi:hypothetical protein